MYFTYILFFVKTRSICNAYRLINVVVVVVVVVVVSFMYTNWVEYDCVANQYLEYVSLLATNSYLFVF